jgi:hypothetical protein
MKRKIVLSAMLACLLAIGLALVGCDSGTTTEPTASFPQVPSGAVKVGEEDFNGKHIVAYQYSIPGFKESNFVRTGEIGNVPSFSYERGKTYIIYIDNFAGRLAIGGEYEGRPYYFYLRVK